MDDLLNSSVGDLFTNLSLAKTVANSDGVLDLVTSIINKLGGKIPLKQTDDFHISLSKTVILKYHWIPTFVESVKTKINVCRKFMVIFDSLKIYCNEERTRTFIGLQIGSGYDSLIKITLTQTHEVRNSLETVKVEGTRISASWISVLDLLVGGGSDVFDAKLIRHLGLAVLADLHAVLILDASLEATI
ncbi:unnamed protein product [Callosobruchus maculatus]|uniref:U6 snRNA phosphodiesterase 1 n=1 Tax=Callosobruchus maculatus TaxID=64391 RepID=A0A653CWW5_CALMS|nr:unnamed protein product [Callosobruchus maculatus]